MAIAVPEPPEILDAWVELHDREDKVVRAGRIHALVRHEYPDLPIVDWNTPPLTNYSHGPSLIVTFEGDTESTIVDPVEDQTLHLRLPVPAKYPAPEEFGVVRIVR